ncbi:MAG: sulfurtransferase-like selenium metabolism protein YedF [Desulfovibrio sp.]|jgi:selenium metabolism protein YedF|nr:sulfurtransferase-like selenium metabolism protein YedF [Desulfovibrio sp.]
MADNTLDCTGLACPEPVMRVRDHIAKNAPDSFSVIVDNLPACENVTRQAQSQGYAVTRTDTPPVWRIDAKKTGGEALLSTKAHRDPVVPRAEKEKILVFIPSNVLGYGDDVLGARLMRNFLLTLPELGDTLWRVILLNGGVKLAIKESPVLEQLQALENQGVTILVCGACLEYFELTAQRAVGETTNMLDVVTAMQLADKVLRI